MVQQVGYGEIVASDDWYIQSSHKPLRKDPSLRWVFFIETWLSDSKFSLRLVIYGGKMVIFAFLKVYKGKTGCIYALKFLIMSHTPLESRKWCFDFFQNLVISMCTVEMFFFHSVIIFKITLRLQLQPWQIYEGTEEKGLVKLPLIFEGTRAAQQSILLWNFAISSHSKCPKNCTKATPINQ